MKPRIKLPSHDIASLDRIAPDVAGLRTLFVNLFAVGRPGAWMLIDAGLYFSASRIRTWAEERFGEDAKPLGILLTHGHFDHAGSLNELAETWHVPVYAHPLEMPYLTGKSKYPPPDPTAGGGGMAYLSFMYPRGPVDLGGRVMELPADGTVPHLPSWRWIHTPGHTAGHVSFFREDDRVLIAGDAFTTTKQESISAVVAQRPELHGPPAYYTSDWEAAKLSVGRLAALIPAVVASGHGLPMEGPEMNDALQYLADNFDVVARPAHGRYVRQPAVTDERGVVTTPPPAPAANYAKAAVIAAGLAGAVWMARSRRRSR